MLASLLFKNSLLSVGSLFKKVPSYSLEESIGSFKITLKSVLNSVQSHFFSLHSFQKILIPV